MFADCMNQSSLTPLYVPLALWAFLPPNGHQLPGVAQPDAPEQRMARAAKVSRRISVTPNGHRQKLAEPIAIIGTASNAG